MAVEEWIKITEVFVSFIQVIIWPVVLLIVLLYFRTALKKFLLDIGELSFKGAGIEATAKRQQIEAAAFLGAASARKSSVVEDNQEFLNEGGLRQIANFFGEATKHSAIRRLNESLVLWVDDRPNNNIFERMSMEALGVQFTTSKSTDDALNKIRLNKYNAIISDMSRPADSKAGYTLLDELRKSHIPTPFIIYAGSNKPEHKEEAKRRGAQGSTNDPQELFQLVLSSILNL